MAYVQPSRCDDYFLVSNDHDALQREQKHLTLRRKQQTQFEIVHKLSKIDKMEYGEDILQDMFESEVR